MFLGDAGAEGIAQSRHLEAQVTKDYHRIEKGLSLRDPKQPFGSSVQKRLEIAVPMLEAGNNHALVETANSALIALRSWNEFGSVDDRVSPRGKPGSDLSDSTRALMTSRHSVRDFSPAEVSPLLIQEAIGMAARSPSVCNRQPWNVRIFSGQAGKRLLAHQNGNSGFGAHVPVVALVTVDARMFGGVGERNQGWIEGGIFASSLVWALHGLGVSTCMLNMSRTNRALEGLREEFSVANHELIIMLIALGYSANEHRVARSPRRSTNEIWLNSGFRDEE